MKAEDNRQIGWAMFQAGGIYKEFLDQQHIINRDLFVRTFNNKSNEMKFNYIVILRKVALTDDEAIISIIKEESQNSTF